MTEEESQLQTEVMCCSQGPSTNGSRGAALHSRTGRSAGTAQLEAGEKEQRKLPVSASDCIHLGEDTSSSTFKASYLRML